MFQNFKVCKTNLIIVSQLVHTRTKSITYYQTKLISRCTLPNKMIISNTCMQNITCRAYSSQKAPGFLSKFVENIKQEMQKNKEMKENLKKFREEAEKLEQSDALKSARKKFQTVESEASKSSEVFKEKIEGLKEKVQGVIDEASKTEIGKKAGQFGEELSKSAKVAAESISEKSQALGKTETFRTISKTAEAVREELDNHGIHGRVYKAPKVLRKRKEITDKSDNKPIEPDLESTTVVMHKDSVFYQSWQNFKDKNPYVNKVLDWKIKYEESDNPVVRASRLLTDKVTDIVGGLFQKTELSETLTEICKIDPNFDKIKFLRDCETDIIPNVLEAMIRGDLEILKDWCHEAPYNIIAQPLKQAFTLGYRLDSKVLDIDNVDLLMGKVMEGVGPVLAISFTSQQIMCVRDAKGKVVEGDPEKVLRVNYVWVLCRDPTELEPRAAWRLLEIGANSTEQFV